MYNIKLDENKYYTGSYAKIGNVEGGIDIPTLPPTDDAEKAIFYKYDYHNVSNVYQVPDINETTGLQKKDENGNLIFKEETMTTSNLEWFFDEEKYNKWLEEVKNKPKELTLEEQVTNLIAENKSLSDTIDKLVVANLEG
jgi:hypothetical protein